VVELNSFLLEQKLTADMPRFYRKAFRAEQFEHRSSR